MSQLSDLEGLKTAMARNDPSVMHARHPEQWSDELPTFGGKEPNCTVGVWSWDEESVLVGTCADDLKILPREWWWR